SSYIDRFTSADNHDLNVELLIENLKDMITEKLSILCVTESSASSSVLSVSFSATSSQSSTPVSVSDSFTLTIPVSVTLTFTTSASATSALSASAVSAFVISSLCFKKMLYRLNELCFSVYTLLLFLSISKIIYYICVFRNENVNIVLFYIHRHKTYIP
ncbi:hypothetical protein BDBG_16989, partial [Blastomyces gilchristii SLH14081]